MLGLFFSAVSLVRVGVAGGMGFEAMGVGNAPVQRRSRRRRNWREYNSCDHPLPRAWDRIMVVWTKAL